MNPELTLNERIDVLERENESLSLTNADLKIENESLNKEVADLEKQLEEAQKDTEKAEQELSDKEDEFDNLNIEDKDKTLTLFADPSNWRNGTEFKPVMYIDRSDSPYEIADRVLR